MKVALHVGNTQPFSGKAGFTLNHARGYTPSRTRVYADVYCEAAFGPRSHKEVPPLTVKITSALARGSW